MEGYGEAQAGVRRYIAITSLEKPAVAKHAHATEYSTLAPVLATAARAPKFATQPALGCRTKACSASSMSQAARCKQHSASSTHRVHAGQGAGGEAQERVQVAVCLQ